jgi:hypothetical protein
MWRDTVMLIEQVALMIEDQLHAIVFLLEEIWFHGGVRNNQWYHVLQLRLSTELSLVVSEMLWVRNLLSELNVLRKGSMRIWCDNMSAINIANNPIQYDRTKHVEIDRFFIKEKLDDGTIELRYVYSSGQIADSLTKGLGVKDCNDACDKMGMIDIYHPS